MVERRYRMICSCVNKTFLQDIRFPMNSHGPTPHSSNPVADMGWADTDKADRVLICGFRRCEAILMAGRFQTMARGIALRQFRRRACQRRAQGTFHGHSQADAAQRYADSGDPSHAHHEAAFHAEPLIVFFQRWGHAEWTLTYAVLQPARRCRSRHSRTVGRLHGRLGCHGCSSSAAHDRNRQPREGAPAKAKGG
jgi:hypothetical protein